MKQKKRYRFSIDRGGTFTDIYCEVVEEKSKRIIVRKLLSEDPSHYDDAPREAIRRIISEEEGVEIKSPKDIDTKLIEWIRMGTTVATNALLERKGEKVVLITSEGFKDLLQIGNQSRPDIFALNIVKPSLLYKNVISIDERVRLMGKEENSSDFGKEVEIREGQSGEKLVIEKKPNFEKIKTELKKSFDEGIKSLAVVLMHSYTFHDHENMIEKIALELGFSHVSLSHKVMPMIRIVPRGLTTLVDAYLSPILRNYVNSFKKGFKNNLEGVDVEFMQSDGGLTSASTFTGSKSIFSGPAGGVVGYSKTAFKNNKPLIGFDMGGTSTDVSRYSGTLEHVYDIEIAGCSIQIPQLDIVTVASGGGSRLFFKQGRFVVGPESSGAHPGPVCYGKNGYLSITDANLILGRLIPEYFPKIFGETEDQPLNYELSKLEFLKLTKDINEYRKKHQNISEEMTVEEVALGFIKVANEQMARPIREITVSRGYDTRNHELCSFGGAAAQHCCAIAKLLGMKKIKIHKFTGILSAVGLSIANVVEEEQEHCNLEYTENNLEKVFSKRLEVLEKKCFQKFDEKKYSSIESLRYLNLRYDRTDYSIMCFKKELSKLTYRQIFEKKYLKEYGFVLPERKIIVDDIRVRCVGKTRDDTTKKAADDTTKKADDETTKKTDDDTTKKAAAETTTISTKEKKTEKYIPKPVITQKTYIGRKYFDLNVYKFEDLKIGTKIKGPSIILQNTSTILVLPNFELFIDEDGNIEISCNLEDEESGKIESPKIISKKADPILLSIFSHRFMSIAEQMGRTLQRTSISTNIKERLDFSCAIFGPSGNLVANAQFIPVHLGSMADAVKFQIQYLKNTWKEGEVIMSNHPSSGGTHLPDITCITPVFYDGKPIFYVASRGHHADIGGITPGSMPPFSKFLGDEGSAVISFKIVKNNKFQLKELEEIMKESRNIKDNIADLKAQIAANKKGIELFKELIKEYSLQVVMQYMKFIQNNAESAVREMLKNFSEKLKKEKLSAKEYMDDGSKIELNISLNKETGDAIFDFNGTSNQVLGNTNAPKAVTTSAVLYCLRCLVEENIPLNYGCLKPITLNIPKNSLLQPSKECAVVGGNVLTSQRITDVVFKCFECVAASQGCMNNFTFGNENFGYYETICGGSGAGDKYNGCDAVHTHMTNTRITDPEILEERYPIVLRKFEIRKNSGGRGKFNGGNGVLRVFEFLRDNLDIGILSERRVFNPYGMNGGENGKKGKNILKKKYLSSNNTEDFEFIKFSLGSKNQVKVNKGDIFEIHTPGGGGFGVIEEIEEEEEIEGELN